jgi:hypothetical protein
VKTTPVEEMVTNGVYQLPEFIRISGVSTESGISNWSKGNTTSTVPLEGMSFVALNVKV